MASGAKQMEGAQSTKSILLELVSNNSNRLIFARIQQTMCRCLCCSKKPLTGNAKTLLTTSFLFFTITALQYVASLPQFANSLVLQFSTFLLVFLSCLVIVISVQFKALRADCLSMFVDGLSYLGNLWAECYPDPNMKKVVNTVRRNMVTCD
jgi:hypothetical protein